MTTTLMMQPFESELRPFEPELRPFEPELRSFEPELRSFEPELRPFEPELRPFEPELRPFEPELRPFERFAFPALPDPFPDVASFRSLGARSRRTVASASLPISDSPQTQQGSVGKVPIYGGILHTVHDTVDYYALVQGRHTGKWSFPKGHLQSGETGPECALREIAEETGLDDVCQQKSVSTLFLHYGTYYVYECVGFEPLLPRDQKEIVHAKWMTLEEMRVVPLNADVSQFRKQRCRLLAMTQSVA